MKKNCQVTWNCRGIDCSCFQTMKIFRFSAWCCQEAQARQKDSGPSQGQDGVHPEQAAEIHDLLQAEDGHHEEGVRAGHPDRHPGDGAGGLGDWSRVHIRHPEAAAHHHLGVREASHPDLPQQPGPGPGGTQGGDGGSGQLPDDRVGVRLNLQKLFHRLF